MKDVLLMRPHIKEAIDDANDETVEKVFKIIKENDEDDFEDPLENLTPEQQAGFFLSLEQADRGETIPHEEVMKWYEKWITK